MAIMGTFTAFDTTTLWEADGTDLLKASNTFKMALFTSAAALTAASGAGLYGGLTNEVANGNGYTTGGVTLTGYSISGTGTTTITFTGPSPSWTASGTGIPAWRWMVIYASGTLNGHVNPCVGFELGDVTNIDVPLTPSGSTITITGNILTITHTP